MEQCAIVLVNGHAMTTTMGNAKYTAIPAKGRAQHPSYNVAKRLVEFDFSITIPRERLRSGYGAGFQGAPLNCDQPQQHPDPRDSGRQGDEARTKQAADADRAPEL
jgi:hypothetical protein